MARIICNAIFNKNKKMIFKGKNILIVLLFLSISLFLLKGIVFSNGILLGGDYNFPDSSTQINSYFKTFSSTWHETNFGMRSLGLSSFLLAFLTFFFTSLFPFITSSIFLKIFLFILFFISMFSFYKFLKFIKINDFIAIIGSIFYITTPIFFNYTIIGWQYVILTLALFPLVIMYFIKSVRDNRLKDKIILTLLIFFSLQTQAIILYFISFFFLSIFLISNKIILTRYIKIIIFTCILFLLTNFYWLIGLLIFPDKKVSGFNILESPISLGTAGNLKPVNIIRLFGSLFNNQFETIIKNYYWLIPFSFLIGFLVIGTFFLKKRKKFILSFFLFGSIPLFFYYLNYFRKLLICIPFSDVIRDFARFSVLSTFAYVVLASLFLNFVFSKNKKLYKLFGFVLILFWFISIFPWWSGEISKWENSKGSDMRLRTKNFSAEYFKREIDFSKKQLTQRAFFLPLGGTVSFVDDKKFKGAFNETQDIFAGYSPIPGVLAISDRSNGYLNSYLSTISENQEKLTDILKLNSTNYFVIRKKMVLKNKEVILDNLNNKEKNGELRTYTDNEELLIYKKTNILPHIYTSNNNLISKRDTDELPRIVSGEDWETRSAVFFEKQNAGKDKILSEIKNSKLQSPNKSQTQNSEIQKDTLPILEFKKINPTKYRIRVHSATGEFPLVFSESFHEGWKNYLTPVKSGKAGIPQKEELFNGVNDYRILDGNEEDQASKEELVDFIQNGWVTSLGNLREREIKHQKWNEEKQKEELDYIEKYKIDFVSKNFQDTIQNDNLPDGRFFETWLPSSYKVESEKFIKESGINKNVIEIPEERHLMVNGYANSWIINTDEVCGLDSRLRGNDNKVFCIQNEDGSYDFEMVVEFWPQRLFYIGAFISISTLLVCIGYLGYDWRKRRKLKINELK